MARYRIPLLSQLLRAFFNRPETVSFPFGPANIPAGFRGRVYVIEENCRGCSLCARDCPAGALEFNRTDKNNYTLEYHPDRCAYCGQCELSCNFDAIHLCSDFVQATQQRELLKVFLVDRHEELEAETD
jgi:formate hydrogenlyase subunit 6/NADH:ubiquinone oxidoreductase subunit I